MHVHDKNGLALRITKKRKNAYVLSLKNKEFLFP